MDIFTFASWVGTVAFAFSGFLIGAKKQLDWMGVFILSMLTANGGGALRDVLVNKPPTVLTDLTGFYMVCGVLVVSVLFRMQRFATIEREPFFVLSDALGLVAFAMTGALVGLEADLTLFGVLVLAFLTASGGGIIRDILVNEQPAILSSDFYGSVALLVGLGVFALHKLEAMTDVNLLLLLAGALCLRIVAYWRHWQLPRIGP